MNTKTHQRGQALILIVLGIVGLVAITALAIDAGNAFSDRRQAQNAADTAALAAALAKIGDEDWHLAGVNRAISNGYEEDTATSTVTVYTMDNPLAVGCDPDNPIPNPVDTSDPYDKAEYYILVTIHSTVNTFFAPIVGIDQLHNCVEAIAWGRPRYTSQLFDGNAVVSLSTSGCALRVQGNNDTTIHATGMFSNADFCNNSGSPSLTAPSLSVVGDISYSPHADINVSSMNNNATPYSLDDILWPTITCSGAAGNVDYPDGDPKTVQLTPGTVSGNFPPNLGGGKKVVALQSGIYCITGNVNLNSDITGDGVLLYIQSGSFSSNGSAGIHLTAMTSGDYSGLLIYAPLTSNNNFTFNGGSDSFYRGTILAPGADVTINGSSGTFAPGSQVVGNTVTFSGNSVIDITYTDADNWDAPHLPSLKLAK
ncbi:MAG: Tad domain-containing protein [Chloroflexota bacterium]